MTESLILKEPAPKPPDRPEGDPNPDNGNDASIGNAADPKAYPVLPLREAVVFPGIMTPLQVGRPKSLAMLEGLDEAHSEILVVTQKDPTDDEPMPHDLYAVGTLARVVKIIRRPEGAVVIVQARGRYRLGEFTQTDPFLIAEAKPVDPRVPSEEDEYWKAAVMNLRESALELIALSPALPDEASQAVNGITDPALLIDFLASHLDLSIEEKQSLLEDGDLVRRLENVQRALNNQLHIAEIQKRLREDMQTEFESEQRRVYLREQMKTIRHELGEGEGTEEQVEDLRQRLDDAALTEKAREQADRELRRLEAIPPASPEHSVITTYLETLAELPWAKLAEERIDLTAAEEVLERDHYGLEKVKRRILEYLAVRKLNPAGRGPILCFAGPPGVGKTSLGKSIAEALGRPFARISLGGIRDEAEIRGHRRTYIGAMPGRIIHEVRRAGARNPVVMLDEVDKLGADFRGDPASALLELLDPAQNGEFVDRYLDVPFDLSQVLFIATANLTDPIPAPLRDRMEIIHIPGYTEAEKRNIASRYLVPRQLEEHGLKPDQCRWSDEAIRQVIDDYTREAGVRNLEREIGSVIRSVAAEVAREKIDGADVTGAVITDALGPKKFVRDEMLKAPSPGVVTGLAYTAAGGDILHIEAIRYPGKGNAKLTGQLGDVMKESVQAAHSLVRSRAPALGIDPEAFEKSDVHVHVPAGAIPKDGPSAGIAMFTALASLFADKPVRHDIAMTGEVTLRGTVLPIGGLKEKSLAAQRAGIKTILIPKGNEKDLPDLPKEVREALDIIPVESVDEVLAAALVPPTG
ncbi:MAG: endopeptidase La [Verrucomicrobiales bacterium]